MGRSEITSGTVAVVTGGSSGMGRALCLRLRARGVSVVAADLNAEGLDDLVQQAPDTQGRLLTHQTDVSDEEAVSSLFERTMTEFGGIDYVFNNAGIVMGGPFEQADTQAWRTIVDVNLWGVIHGTRIAYDLMRTQGRGHIINTSSSAGAMPVPYSSAYAATKHAVVGLSTSLRGEAKKHGVKVSVVLPGMVDTGIFGAAKNLGDYNYEEFSNRAPVKKVSADAAAGYILNGVERNHPLIVFPFYNKLLVKAYALAPSLLGPLIASQSW